MVLWNTLYLDAVLDQLRWEVYEVLSDDVSHLSPLGFEHINFLGRYEFTLAQTVQQGN